MGRDIERSCEYLKQFFVPNNHRDYVVLKLDGILDLELLNYIKSGVHITPGSIYYKSVVTCDFGHS